jgi:methyl-accepting chemotaxis protein
MIPSTKNVINLVTFIVLGIIVFILFNLYKTISSPIKELKEVAENFSRGDISVIMNDNRTDEFGEVASHFNTAIYKMNDMIAGVQNLTDSISLDSDKLSSSSVQIDKNAQEQSSQTTQAASAMEELNRSFIDVAKNTAHAADSSKEASEVAVQGGEIVSETITGINKISQVVNESAETIGALGDSSEQIGEIIKVINDIAGQTNLLALNAAIEAARAGEQGRGFAVVADEVRKLAERTTSATNEISDMIKGFQNGTQKAVESMHSGTKEVEEGVKLSNKAGDSLKKIVESSNNVTEMVQQIATAAEEQSTTGDVIAANVEAIATIAQQTANSANESATSTQGMNRSILELKQLVSVFTLRQDTLNNRGADVSSQEDHSNEAPHPSS